MQTSIPIVSPRDRVPRPSRTFGPNDIAVHENGLRAHGVLQRAVVPLQDLFRAVEVERVSLKALFGEWFMAPPWGLSTFSKTT